MLGQLLSFIIFIAALIGWVMNIIQLSQYDHFTGMVMVRAVGVLVAPLGAILGWF